MILRDQIYVQIASYRDPELLPTIKDCLAKAKYPNRLTFGICWQHSSEDKWDNLDEYKNNSKFRIMDVPHQDAESVCWARNNLQKMWRGEKYTLQLDSHHRFEQDWDETLVEMMETLFKKGHKKPLLTAYIPSYDPTNDPNGRAKAPWRMAFDRFTPEGVVFFLPEDIPNWKDLDCPVPSRFFSAHFAFTLGIFCKEVQYDPNYYFHGEEISLAARAYTAGYDLFHPHKPVVYHEYTRKGRTKQWDDDKKWPEKNSKSHLRNRKLFSMDGETFIPQEFGIYGFGRFRSLRDYERYSGLLFSKRAVQQYVLDKNYPPNPKVYDTEEEWIDSHVPIFKHCIDIGYDQLPEKDYDFFAVAFHGEDGETLFRQDADEKEIERLFKDPDKYCKIWREFHTEKRPKYWVVWPHSKSKEWCDAIRGDLR